MVPKHKRNISKTETKFIAFKIMFIVDSLRMWFPECFAHAFGDDMARSAQELLSYTTTLCRSVGNDIPMARYRFACANIALTKLDDFELKVEECYLQARAGIPGGVNYIDGMLLTPAEVCHKMEQTYIKLMPMLSDERIRLEAIVSGLKTWLTNHNAFQDFNVATTEEIVRQEAPSQDVAAGKVRATAWCCEDDKFETEDSIEWLENWLFDEELFNEEDYLDYLEEQRINDE